MESANEEEKNSPEGRYPETDFSRRGISGGAAVLLCANYGG